MSVHRGLLTLGLESCIIQGGFADAGHERGQFVRVKFVGHTEIIGDGDFGIYGKIPAE